MHRNDIRGSNRALLFCCALATLLVSSPRCVGAVGISDFVLIDSANDQPLAAQAHLESGSTVGFAKIERLNVQAVADASVASVRFELDDGHTRMTRTDRAAPFALFGDRAGDFEPWRGPIPFPGRSYVLTATPFLASEDGTERAVEPRIVRFQLEDPTPPTACAGDAECDDRLPCTRDWCDPEKHQCRSELHPPSCRNETTCGGEIVRIALLDAGHRSAIHGFGTLNDGVVIPRCIAPEVTFEAITEPASIGSILFELDDGDILVSRFEDTAPYLFFGDCGIYHGWPSPGPELNHTYSLSATPFTKPGGQGERGQRTTVRFRFSEDTAAACSSAALRSSGERTGS